MHHHPVFLDTIPTPEHCKFGMEEWLNGPIIILAVTSLLNSLSMISGC